MSFFDLNIPYHESDRNAIDKSSLKSRRLKLALKAMELGYTGIAYNRTLRGVMSESDHCSTTLFPISKLIPSSSSFFAAVKFHRELLNVALSSPFRQYSRLTVIVDIPSHVSALNVGNPILKGYDIVAVRPMNQNAFDQACQTSEVDIIAIDFAEKLPLRLKQPMIKAAIKRGVYFEITYSGFLADAQSRRQMISNCKLLVDWTRGKNLIFSSAASSATDLRGPQDVANLFSLIGLPIERAKASISKNCRSLLANALKKQFYKEAVKVEEVNPKESSLDEWFKWDPISSGDGDLLLDDMEKSFAISATVMENVKRETVKIKNFVSDMNGLPVHGLKIKDLICSTKAEKSSLPENQESSLCSNLSKEQMRNGAYSNSGETVSLSSEKLNYSNNFELASETLLLDNNPFGRDDLRLPDDGQEIKKTISEHHIQLSNASSLNVESLLPQEDVSILNKIDTENIQGSSPENVPMGGREQYSLVKPIEGVLDMARDFVEPTYNDVKGEPEHIDDSVADDEGHAKSLPGIAKVRRKRNRPRQPFLFPSKHLPFKRKSRK